MLHRKANKGAMTEADTRATRYWSPARRDSDRRPHPNDRLTQQLLRRRPKGEGGIRSNLTDGRARLRIPGSRDVKHSSVHGRKHRRLSEQPRRIQPQLGYLQTVVTVAVPRRMCQVLHKRAVEEWDPRPHRAEGNRITLGRYDVRRDEFDPRVVPSAHCQPVLDLVVRR